MFKRPRLSLLSSIFAEKKQEKKRLRSSCSFTQKCLIPATPELLSITKKKLTGWITVRLYLEDFSKQSAGRLALHSTGFLFSTESRLKTSYESTKHSAVWHSGASLTCPLRITRSDLSGHQLRLLRVVPRIKSKSAEGAFCYCGPRLWNELPSNACSITTVSTSETKLKTSILSSLRRITRCVCEIYHIATACV